MNQSPLISVVMPAFNCASFIGAAIESVLSQTYRHWELIVVDDGSTDDTANIVAEISEKDARVRLVSFPNAGSCVARNRGFDMARGEYIALLDADDLWPECKLATQLAELSATGADVVLGNVQRFTENEQGERSLGFISAPPSIDSPCINSWEYLKSVLLVRNTQMANFTTALARADVIKTHGHFDPEMTTAHDWEVWLRLCGRFKFAHINRVLLYYRKHPASHTRHCDIETAVNCQIAAIERHSPSGIKGWLIAREAKSLRFEMAIATYLDQSQPLTAVFWYGRGLVSASFLWRLESYRWLARIAKALKRVGRSTVDTSGAIPR